MNFLSQLIVAIATNLIAGLYSGLVVARYARFAGLQREAKRLVQAFDSPLNDAIESATVERVIRANTQFSLIASEFYFLKHWAAGNTLMLIAREFDEIIGSRRVLGFEEKYGRWQEVIREMRPNWRALLNMRFSV
jgi:hypothetical protein